MKVYQDLYELIRKEIEKYMGTAEEGLSLRTTGEGTLSASELSQIITGIADNLAQMIAPRIINGLEVKATTPPSSYVLVSPGNGTVNGKTVESHQEIKIQVPVGWEVKVLYVTLYDTVYIQQYIPENHLALAKVIIPSKFTAVIQDDMPADSYDGYIISGRDLLFENKFEIDDESISELRNVMSELLADNLIGNLRLSENLKITNTQGTLEMDSKEIKIRNFSGKILAKFNQYGTYFYDENGRERARFTSTDARIANVSLSSTGLVLENGADIIVKDDGFIKVDSGAGASTLITANKIFIGQKDGVGVDLSGADGTHIYIDIHGIDGQYIKPASIKTNSIEVEDFFLENADWSGCSSSLLSWGTEVQITYFGETYNITENNQTNKKYILWSPISHKDGLTEGTGNGFYEIDILPEEIGVNEFLVAKHTDEAPYYLLPLRSTIISGDAITTGTINTSNVKIQSADGLITINGSLITVKDEGLNPQLELGKLVSHLEVEDIYEDETKIDSYSNFIVDVVNKQVSMQNY